MKIFVSLLAILACAAAQERKACLRLYSSDDVPRKYSIGDLTLTQPSPLNQVRIEGVLKNLNRAWYVAMVHEKKKFTNNCNALGVIDQVAPDTLFTLASVRIQSRGFERVQETAIWGTLQPDKPDSIVGRTVALYDASTFDDSTNTPATPSVACGYVTGGSACGAYNI